MPPDPYTWSLHPEAVAAIALLVAAYGLSLRRWPAPPWRVAVFALAALLLLATAVTPLDSLTFHLLSAHLLQNVVLAEWAPALIVLGIAPALAAALTENRLLRTLTRPAVALPLWVLTYILWHLPPAYDAALEHPATLLHLEHACYVATGCLLWWPVFQDAPWRLAPGLRAGYVVAAFVLTSPIGLMLALLPDTVYEFYADQPGLWGLSPLTDQQAAGIAMASEQAVVFFVVFAAYFARFLADEERGEAYAGNELHT